MAAFKPKQVPQSIFVVFLFWGLSLMLFYADGGFDPVLLIEQLVVVLFALYVATYKSWAFRSTIKKTLIDSTWHGIWSSLGQVPVHQSTLPATIKFDPKTLLDHYPAEIKDQIESALNTYVKENVENNSHYVSLFYALLRLLTSPEHIGYLATYHIDATGKTDVPNTSRAHGNRSLLTHSLLVFGLGMMGFESYCKNYTPDKPKRANNLEFRPSENDPIMGLLTLAHDIGKLQTFRLVNNDGKIVVKKILKNHAAHGTRVLALIPEFWHPSITPEDRSIILNVLACYHHPQDLPYVPANEDGSEKCASDRETALLKYLITTDKRAGAVEGGMDVSTVLATIQELPIIDDVSEQDDWVELFIRFLATNNEINMPKGLKSIAFKTEVNQKSLLVFDEKLFLNSFCEFIKKREYADLKTHTAPHPITSNLLTKLDSLSVVYRADKGEVFGRAANLSLFSATFSTEPETEPFLVINSAFILDVTNWEPLDRIKSMPNVKAVIKFGKCKFGGRGLRKDPLLVAINEEITGEVLPTEITTINAFATTTETTLGRKIKGSVIKGMIKAAISKKQIEVAKEFEKDGVLYKALLVNEAWFSNNNITHNAIYDPRVMNEAGIVEIKESKKAIGMKIITISF